MRIVLGFGLVVVGLQLGQLAPVRGLGGVVEHGVGAGLGWAAGVQLHCVDRQTLSSQQDGQVPQALGVREVGLLSHPTTPARWASFAGNSTGSH